MKKIKKLVPHDCRRHYVPISQLFLGYEENKFAIRKEDQMKAKWGMLVQCNMCKTVTVVPMEDVKPEEEENKPNKKEETTDV